MMTLKVLGRFGLVLMAVLLTALLTAPLSTPLSTPPTTPPTTPPSAAEVPRFWPDEWPNTDFNQRSVEWSEIQSGGPPRDGIPSIDNPTFKPVSAETDLGANEPVISLTVGKVTKLYPLRILMWHEIVNDVIDGQPVTVTYCPLCNAAIVFDARLDGRKLTFGTTGKLRNSDLVMYDRETESWWQQFSGEAIVGAMNGRELTMLPVRMESFAIAKTKAKASSLSTLVLQAPKPQARRYGENPYVGYDTLDKPFLYSGEMPKDIAPMMRVVVVDGQAWTLPLLRQKETIEWQDLVLSWTSGQNSALDSRTISKGRDVGNVTVKRRSKDGLKEVVHHVTFAFVFTAFHPDGNFFTQ